VDPDILLIDEVLAVGDEAFTRRCIDHLARMRRKGITMVLVTHDLDMVGHFADRTVYLNRGRVIIDGSSEAAVARYRSDVAGGGAEREERLRQVRIIEEGRRWGNGDIEIAEVFVTGGGARQRMLPSGAGCTIHLRYKVNRPVEDFVFGIAWHRVDGGHVGGHNTEMDGLDPRGLTRDGEIRCRYDTVQLSPGDYQLDVAVHAADGLAYDYWCDAARVRITSAVDWPGVWAPSHRWEGEGPEWQ
jgi:hypothetical protein